MYCFADFQPTHACTCIYMYVCSCAEYIVRYKWLRRTISLSKKRYGTACKCCTENICTENTQTHTHTLKYSYTHTLIHSYTHTLKHSYTHTLIHSYTHTLIHSYTHTLIHSNTHTLIHSYTHTLIHSYTHTLIYSYPHASRYTQNTIIQSYVFLLSQEDPASYTEELCEAMQVHIDV